MGNIILKVVVPVGFEIPSPILFFQILFDWRPVPNSVIPLGAKENEKYAMRFQMKNLSAIIGQASSNFTNVEERSKRNEYHVYFICKLVNVN